MLSGTLFALGLIGIFASLIYLNESMAFPGWVAVIPALGTALVILSKNPVWLSGLLTNPMVRYIGLISYSLYLVHWPVLSYLRIEYGEVGAVMLGAASVIIFLLAATQYHLVETPLRIAPGTSLVVYDHSRRSIAFNTFSGAAISTIVVSGLALIIIQNNGYPDRYKVDLQRFASLTLNEFNEVRSYKLRQLCSAHRDGTICGAIDPEKMNVLIVGDSHGSDGVNIFSKSFPEINLLAAGRGACPLLESLEDVVYRFDNCDAYNDRRFADIAAQSSNIDYIVFSQRISIARMKSMRETFKIMEAHGLAIIVLGAGPRFKRAVLPEVLKHKEHDKLDQVLAEYAVTKHYAANMELQQWAERSGGVYLNKTDLLCPENLCRIILDDGHLLMIDQHHLSLSAAEYLGASYRKNYPNLFEKR